VSEIAQPASRRRRADAERSIAAILDAAVQVLNRRPDASVEEIAKVSGVSRQTVYAHFPSREALLDAVVDRATREVMTSMDLDSLDEGSPTAAMVRLLDLSWQTIRDYPLLLHLQASTSTSTHDRHQPVLGFLDDLIERGKRAGEFDTRLSTSWLVAATISLGDAAGDGLRAGRLTDQEAATVLRVSVLRLLGADEPTDR
jgi:AcrR family transcriptional regulator